MKRELGSYQRTFNERWIGIFWCRLRSQTFFQKILRSFSKSFKTFFQSILRPFWRRLKNSLKKNFEYVFKKFPDCFSKIFRSFSKHFQTVFKKFWDPFQKFSRHFSKNFEVMLKSFQTYFPKILRSFSKRLETFFSNFEVVLNERRIGTLPNNFQWKENRDLNLELSRKG